ncbi:MAG: HhH-GPD-type base excision DNA repair protein [Chloroflexota bacterium]
MPKLERLEWISPLSEGKGVTLSDDPEADQLLAENPDALLLGVLYDSQFQTRRAFAIPLRLKMRLGFLDMPRLAAMDPVSLQEIFTQKPSLHRFPRKFASHTQNLAAFVTEQHGGDSARIWSESTSAEHLAQRILALPAFGTEKTDWTVGMLGIMGWLPFDGWQGYRVPPKVTRPRKKAPEA